MNPVGSIQIVGDQIHLAGLLAARERHGARRAAMKVVVSFIVALCLGGSLVVGILWLRAEKAHREEVIRLKFFSAVSEAKVSCLEERTPFSAGRLQSLRVRLDECVAAELARRGYPRDRAHPQPIQQRGDRYETTR